MQYTTSAKLSNQICCLEALKVNLVDFALYLQFQDFMQNAEVNRFVSMPVFGPSPSFMACQ